MKVIAALLVGFSLGGILVLLGGNVTVVQHIDSGMYVKVDGVMHKLTRIEPDE